MEIYRVELKIVVDVVSDNPGSAATAVSSAFKRSSLYGPSKLLRPAQVTQATACSVHRKGDRD